MSALAAIVRFALDPPQSWKIPQVLNKAGRPLCQTKLDLIEYLRAHPGSTTRDAREAFPGREYVATYLAQMYAANLLRIEGDPKHYRYFLR